MCPFYSVLSPQSPSEGSASCVLGIRQCILLVMLVDLADVAQPWELWMQLLVMTQPLTPGDC